MRDLAPTITRQRLLMEGFLSVDVDETVVKQYLLQLARELGLRSYAAPIVHAPQGSGKPENEGFDAFLPLIDSGISLYIWTAPRFFAAVLFTCKRFDVQCALEFTRRYFAAPELEFTEF